MSNAEYMENQLQKHLRENDDSEEVSSCCGSMIEENEDYFNMCCEYRDECTSITTGEYETEKYQNAMCDAGDAKRELDREER